MVVAAAFAATALLPPTPAPAAGAARAGYVGIVIAGKGSSCVRWHAGITGDEVLNDVASVRYRYDGLIVQVDGAPSPAKADATHYWSYWHDTSGSWQYSNSGASGYQPKAGSVEGWAYDNGAKNAAPPGGGGGLYASLCGSRDAPSPPARRSSARGGSTTASHRPASHRPATTGPATTGPATTSSRRTESSRPPSSPARIGTATPASRTPVTGRNRSDAHLVGSSTTSAPNPSNGSTTPTVGVAGSQLVKPAASSATGGSPWPVILGVALVLLLGAGGGWGVLRRRRADAAEH